MSKGGEQKQESTSETKTQGVTSARLPAVLEQTAAQDIALANEIGRIGYVPYQGPTVAGLSGPQQAAMANTNAAASAFGLAQAPVAPQPQYMGGEQGAGMTGGYSPYDLYMQALMAMPAGQRGAIESYLIDPNTGALPTRGMGEPPITPRSPGQKGPSRPPARSPADSVVRFMRSRDYS